MVSKHGRELGIVGGVLGLITLALPWLVLTASGLGLYASVGVTPIQMFQGIQNSSSGSDLSAIPQDLLTRLEAAVGLLLVGIVVYVLGCVMSFVRPHGGAVMLAGVAISTMGALSFGTYSVLVASLSLGPGIGEGLAAVAGILALAGVFVKEPTQPVMQLPPPLPPPPWPDTSKPWPPQQAAPPVAPLKQERFCPVCGAHYTFLQPEVAESSRFCPKDGSELKVAGI